MGLHTLRHALLLAILLAGVAHVTVGRLVPDQSEATDLDREKRSTNQAQLYSSESYEDDLQAETEAVDALEKVGDKLDKIVDRVWSMESGKDASLTSRLEGVSKEAERLQEGIADTIDDELDDTGDVERDVDVIKTEADILADDVSSIVNDVRSGKVRTNSDVTFDRELTSLKAEADDVVEKLKRAEKKAKRAERKKKKSKGRKRKERTDRKASKDYYQSLKPNTTVSWLPQPSDLMSDTPYYRYNRANYGRRVPRYREQRESSIEVIQGNGDDRNVIINGGLVETRSSSSSQAFRGSYVEMVNYFRGCDDCMMKTTDYNCPLHEDALNMKKYMQELQELISYGCKKPESCTEPGTCCVADRPKVRDLMNQLSNLARDIRQLIETECKDCFGTTCSWSDWSNWGSCSVTCGRGRKTRMRRKVNPPKTAADQDCEGPAVEYQDCLERECAYPVDGNWSPWGDWRPCSVSCERGTTRRIRSCNNPPPSNGGRFCDGLSYDTKACDSGPCPIICREEYDRWEDWSSCTTTCGLGRVSRRRRCRTAPGCPACAEPFEIEEKTTRCGVESVNGNWGSWGTWTQCSVTCGRGMTTRERYCDSPAPNACGQSCPGRGFESKECNSQPCKDCREQYTRWTEWSTCRGKCGVEKVTRQRQCYTETGCPPCLNRIETEEKDQQCGPDGVDGNWGSWGTWAQCSVTCGRGMTSRKRYCDSPAPNACGQSCPGRGYESKECNNQPCMDCREQYTRWTEWSTCRGSCGVEKVTRQRQCYTETGCPPCLNRIETEEKDQRCGPEGVDGNWGNWGTWTQCSVTCGRGITSRERSCDSPAPNACGQSCPGRGYESKECNSQPCRDCREQYTRWTEWSTCRGSCGVEKVTRQRQCYTETGCPPCLNRIETEEKDQRCGPDEREAQWQTWGSWSTCPVTCGGGKQFRTRSCNPSLCETPCLGIGFEDIDCGTAQCPPDEPLCEKSWSSWGEWSSCSATCGASSRTRTRRCETVRNGRDCNLAQCPGSDRDVWECDVPQCCEWGQWSECSATCQGSGVQMREGICLPARRGDIAGPQRQIDRRTCVRTDGPLCPGAIRYTWQLWKSWCACNCRSGVTTRNRVCFDEETQQNVDSAFCTGSARENKTCDVRDIRNCPQCIMSCEGRTDGNHPSCTGCDEYIKCTNGEAKLYKCREGTEWDGFLKKCTFGLSPTCTLKVGIRSCDGLVSGNYHTLRGCGRYIVCSNNQMFNEDCDKGMEFNYYSQTCERLSSPSCIRIDPNLEYGGAEINIAEIGGVIRPVNDAPVSDYYNSAIDITEEEAKEKYIAEIKKEMKEERSNTLITYRNRDCIEDCTGRPLGRYASCRGCEFYTLCTVHGRLRERQCKQGRQYDSKLKRCMRTSTTCKMTFA